MYRGLMHGGERGRSYAPWEIRAMTVPEVALALDRPSEDEHRAPAGGKTQMPGGSAEYARQWRALPASEKKRRMREG